MVGQRGRGATFGREMARRASPFSIAWGDGFLAGAVLAPMPAPAPHAASLHVKRQLETLREQVAVLEEEEVIDANKADDLRDTAQRVADDAKADDPVRAWEALDHLARQLEDEGAQAQEAAQQQSIEAAGSSHLGPGPRGLAQRSCQRTK